MSGARFDDPVWAEWANWAMRAGCTTLFAGLKWDDPRCLASFEAWVASRAAMIIDLPEKMPNEDAGEDADIWFNKAIDECRESIHAAGAKTK